MLSTYAELSGAGARRPRSTLTLLVSISVSRKQKSCKSTTCSSLAERTRFYFSGFLPLSSSTKAHCSGCFYQICPKFVP